MIRHISIFLISLALITGCGSSSKESRDKIPLSTPKATATPSPSPKTSENITKTKGYFIESLPIEGVNYLCANGTTGLTDERGMFECEEAPVVFKVGNLTLGTVKRFTVDSKVYLQDLLGVERDTYSDEDLKLLARLILSVDNKNIETKITIDKDVRGALYKERDLKDMTERKIYFLLDDMGKTLVEECEALVHLGDTTLDCAGDGSYYVEYLPPIDNPTPTPTPSLTATPTPSPTPTPTPSPTPTPIHKLKITLKSTQKIAGYEVHLKFTNDTPTSVTLENSFLGTTGRTVNDLGADINSSTKEIKFGGFTFGNQEAVSGEFDILSFQTEDNRSELSITKQICLDRDANDIACNIEIK